MDYDYKKGLKKAGVAAAVTAVTVALNDVESIGSKTAFLSVIVGALRFVLNWLKNR